ncbi:MAG: N-acetylmuramoyl-L-alanine amidase [Ignavibacteriales bacterium]|nr:N-acetylmuramoyl-L-alanine amidase [Ignavibacteriales bacterium]
MRLACFLKVILFALVFSLCQAQTTENKTSLTFRLASGDTTVIGRIDSAGVLFFSLNDFLKSLQLPASVNDSTGKIECLIALQLVRFTDRNPFVVITERTSNTATMYQMSGNVIRRRGEFFVPANTFIQLYERLTEQRLSIDAQHNTLSLETFRRLQYSVAGIEIEKKINGSLITIHANTKLGDVESWLKPDGWLFVTIMGADADTIAINATKPFGAVRKVLTFQSPASLQLTFQVTPDVVQAETVNDPASNDIHISLRTLSTSEKEELKKKKQEAKKQQLTNGRDRWKLDVIVIDAGHGGKDPGCIGVVGTREKNITLDVGLKLGHIIETNLRGVKVVYTRSSDKFVELYKRTQIANETGGKLFISIHCNSLTHKPSRMNGFEIYLLRPGRTEDAVTVASRENAVIQLEEGYKERYQNLTEEKFIIVTMAQSAYMKQSEQFAESAVGSMAKRLRIKNSGVKQAGFQVLVGASMPNVLVELGYLSNRNEEQFLRSENGQDRIADALFRGIKDYKMKYEKSLQEGIEDK